MSSGWPKEFPGPAGEIRSLAAADLDKDGRLEILAVKSGAGPADLDGDGEPEVILYSNHEKAGDTANLGNCLWALHGDMTRAKGFEKPLCSDAPIFQGYLNNIVETTPAPALGDLAGDARPEIVVPSNDGKIRGYSPEGVELWKYTYDVAGEPWIQASEAVIGDLNKDGSPEIVFTITAWTTSFAPDHPGRGRAHAAQGHPGQARGHGRAHPGGRGRGP